MFHQLRLVSHHLCPYVQRAVITAGKLGIPFERLNIDLSAKPDWFLAISPTGKVPVLQVTREDGGEHVLFESAPIAEFLNDIGGGDMLSADPVERAVQRAWIEFASGTLSEIAGLYAAPTAEAFAAKSAAITARLGQIEGVVGDTWFWGDRFTLVDAAYGPVFRYLDLFERRLGLRLMNDLPKVAAWRARLAADPVVASAVAADYPQRLEAFMLARGTEITRRLEAVAA